MKSLRVAKRRIIKTGISVFLTALVCSKLELPVIFAVITAIVTTEPTAAASLKKGFVRIPAAAIGALFALIFDALFGHSALTFALVSMLTILFCHHLKLDNGTLVATLTAVVMIPGVHSGVFSEFFLRLAGTCLGIIISTLVNFAILPPKFGPLLFHKINKLYEKTTITRATTVIQRLCINVLDEQIKTTRDVKEEMYHLLKKEIDSDSFFSQKEALYYELVAILDCLLQLQTDTYVEKTFVQKNKDYPSYVFKNLVQYD